MFLGILIALICCGVLTCMCNPIYGISGQLREHRSNMRLLGVCLVFIGGFGAAGWIIEVLSM